MTSTGHGSATNTDMDQTSRSWSLLRRLWLHATMLAVLLLSLLPLANNGSLGVVDESVYSYQAANLADGSWASPRPLPQIARTGSDGALLDSVSKGDQWIPYARQPLYPIVLSPFYRLGGYSGILLISVLGTWIASTVAAAIATRIEPAAAIATLWLTALGTPLFFYSFLAVGHSLVAAMVGLCAFGLLRSWGDGDSTAGLSDAGLILSWTLVAVLGSGAAVLLRSEGALAVGSLALAGTVIGLRVRGRQLVVTWRKVGPSIAVGLAGIIAYVGNARWSLLITGGAGATSGGIDRRPDPLRLAWISLVRPWGGDGLRPSVLFVLGILCTLLAAIALRTSPTRPFVAGALVSIAAVLMAIRQFEPPAIATGLIVTVPVVVFGLLLLGRAELSQDPVRLLLVASAMTVASILWFAYGEGGGAEWGGRFFQVTIPLLVPVSVVSIVRRLRGLPVGYRTVAGSALVVLTLSISLLSFRVLLDLRTFNRDVVREAVAASTPGAPVVAAPINQTSLSRFFWAEVRDGYPLLNGGNPVTLTRLLPSMRRAGVKEFDLITDTDWMTVQYSIDLSLKQLGIDESWEATNERRLGRTGYAMFTVRQQ